MILPLKHGMHLSTTLLGCHSKKQPCLPFDLKVQLRLYVVSNNNCKGALHGMSSITMMIIAYIAETQKLLEELKLISIKFIFSGFDTSSVSKA